KILKDFIKKHTGQLPEDVARYGYKLVQAGDIYLIYNFENLLIAGILRESVFFDNSMTDGRIGYEIIYKEVDVSVLIGEYYIPPRYFKTDYENNAKRSDHPRP